MQSTFQLKASRLACGAVLGMLAPMTAAAQNGTSNPGRDFNLQTYERRYDPGAASQPYYHPQNPGQQYNSQVYERRYRPGTTANPPRIVGGTPDTTSPAASGRVQSLKPARKTDEQARRAQRRKAKDDDD